MIDRLTTLDAQLETDFQAARIPGMALLASRDGELMYEKYAGYRDVAEKKPVTAETVFGLASLTKSVVAVAVMMLQDEGKLSISDRVVKWLPEFKKWNQFYKQHITIHHLLTHTAGFAGMGAFHLARRRSIEKDPDGVELFGRFEGEHYVHTVRDLMEAMIEEDVPFIATPGELFNYSNESYALLQEVIERASGKSFVEFIESNLFQPLGMCRSTFSFENWEDFNDVTELYAFSTKPPHEVFHTPAWWGSGQIYGPGALKASAKDVQRYLEIFRKHGVVDGEEFVSKESMTAMMRPQVTTPNGVSYGYGLIVGTYQGRRVIGHGGGIKGVSSYMLIGKDDITVTVLTNIAEVAAENFAMSVLETCWPKENADNPSKDRKGESVCVERSAYENISKDVQLEQSELALYAGHYETNERQTVDVTVAESGLQLQIQQQSVQVKPCGNHQFHLPDGKKVTFIVDESGKVRGIFRGMRFIQKQE